MVSSFLSRPPHPFLPYVARHFFPYLAFYSWLVGIVFVYKLGSEWGEKKSICNKFVQSSSVTCVCWPQSRPNEVVFGVTDGKVRIGRLRSNKSATLYDAGSFTVSLCTDGVDILSGHLDERIYRYAFDEASAGARLLCQHSCVPYAISWGLAVCAAGPDQMVRFYDGSGATLKRFDFSRVPGEKEFIPTP